ncbi:MAG: hypothetical protein ACLFU0_07635 [Alphaproteobacteria bacterium]
MSTRLRNVPFIPLWMLRDDALVAMMASADLVHVLDDEQPLSPATKAKSERAFRVTRDINGVTHSQAERRKAVLAFIAAAANDLGEEVAVTVAGPLPELGGAKVFLLLPDSALVTPEVTPA